MVLKKYEIEAALHAEHQAISAGKLREDNPLDSSEEFRLLCEACRRGDLKICQEKILEGVNINGRDRFDYTPLILASLCGHYEVVQLLLESGALCERDTFQGERCLYNALNDRIRNLLLQYDYSKSTDPLQPFAAHVTALLSRETPQTSDITVVCTDCTFRLHKLVLGARSPYFSKKFTTAPETTSWRLPNTIPSQSLEIALRYLYFADVAVDLGDGEAERDILTGVDKLSKQFQIESLFESILERDRRLARQQRTDELARGRQQFENWFQRNIVANKVEIETAKAKCVRWDRNNSIFADVLIQADEPAEEEELEPSNSATPNVRRTDGPLDGIPVGPFHRSRSSSPAKRARRSVLYPAHKAMLIRAEYFLAMFSSGFKESQETDHLQIISVDFSPEILELILAFLYCEKADIPLSVAVDVLWAADQLFIEKLKTKAAVIISTLGNGEASVVEADNSRGGMQDKEIIDIYEVVRTAWDTRVPRLEEFGARYLAYRLERHIDTEQFAELVQDSASRIQARQETDTVELVDDIRFYLSERFRLRFEDAGLEEMMDELGIADTHDDVGTQGEDGDLDARGPQAPSDTVQAKLLAADRLVTTDGPGGTVIRTLDGEIVGDEFSQEAMNYQILLAKLDKLLERLGLDA